MQPSSQQSSFQGLTPGAPYRMVVVSHSGEQSNQTSVRARTGNSRTRAHLPTRIIWCVQQNNFHCAVIIREHLRLYLQFF